MLLKIVFFFEAKAVQMKIHKLSVAMALCISRVIYPRGEYSKAATRNLKVFTNEKRDGLTVVSFDRSCFKLCSRKFSNKLVQAPSCERPKTAPRTLFLSFANNNCFQITV
jgi:hypothetical protein